MEIPGISGPGSSFLKWRWGRKGQPFLAWRVAREEKDQKAYKYLSNFKMQIPCLWPSWDSIFHYHLSGKKHQGRRLGGGGSREEVGWKVVLPYLKHFG